MSEGVNPKDLIGLTKLPLSLVPITAKVYGCLGQLDGMLKYGRYNWRMFGIFLSVYVEALERHIEALKAGEWVDTDSGLPHVSHILATANILADAYALGLIICDYAPQRTIIQLGEPDYTDYRTFINRMTTHVPRLKALHAGRNPRHYGALDVCHPPVGRPEPSEEETP